MNTDKVTVIGIDESKIKQHSTNPQYIELPFVLSCSPDETWIGICVSLYGGKKPSANRRMFTLDNSLIIVANLDDNLEEHKRIVEEVINETNKKYFELLQKTKEERERTEKEMERNKARLTEFKERVKKLYK
ncbi:MAG: hypothetical protein WBB37_04650 [bacterium]